MWGPAAGSGGVAVPESSPAGGPAAGSLSAFAFSLVVISAGKGAGVAVGSPRGDGGSRSTLQSSLP